MKKNQVISIFLFTLLGLIALQIPFTRLLGSSVKFTAFDFIAPTAGAFVGTFPGVISVLIMQFVNYLLHGSQFDIGGIIRLFPTLFAVLYFAKRRPTNILIPVLAIIAFNLNPIGRSAWQYSMFWLIPIAANFFHKNLFLKSLGATFTAHAVGGALWVWTFGLTKEIWLGLIPVVIVERLAMASGITLFYFVFSKAIKFVTNKKYFHFPNISTS
ncbi:hypothetical protein A2773_07065 [Candidatus Gottesmanbacteria bacterium RIFCSPHIGHO2_01_FULL_39_10]|uniref:ECF transporter S component n=1 Tax=Candidatus Gottesmanbacteria bacterium RIFCSPHIGHO2_01_FULL_39_10 TaxID=1798375 RepID=A0A1F5ZR20_9BACT|nr:MAG: hypothetical protein A2773_07065 [Candidatus Gottesmanbacteria bacterium RIFCSPHIGHO2_01_FULL_39_10]